MLTVRRLIKFLAIIPMCGHAQSRPTVSLEGERVEGQWSAAPAPAVAAFKGIPYAAPPVGAFRWKPTQRYRSVPGRTHDASQFGHACMQPVSLDGEVRGDVSEDCLTLNVWTTDPSRDSAPRPVIVWIHGGSNIAGTSGRTYYDGTTLARRGVVLVSINYRVGVMGFFAHPALSREGRAHASGNYALLDILSALGWVQRNIAEFGGDSTRVTVYGQSAGANNIVHLMASPLAKGLFQRAIPQSGAPMDGLASLTTAERFGTIFARSLGVAPDSTARDDEVLKALRAVPAETVMQAQSVFLQSGIFQPIVDGLVLREMTARVFDRGKQMPVPLILGSTALEMSSLRDAMPAFARTLTGYRTWVGDTFGASRDSMLALYPAPTDSDVDLAARRLVTDFYFTCQTRLTARAMTRVATPSYLYLFSRVPPGEEGMGAYHAADIDYVFNARDPARKREAPDSTLSDTMVGYWLRFAATGDPNGPSLPLWPAYRASDDAYQELGTTIGARTGLGASVCGLVEPVLRKLWRTRE
ncbi:MAG: carboxylesterase family protein [Gemmatimonadaceae bacterium]|nr:carboxylesterase family protein [Gemmatimonadaceae bacterium]